MHRITYLLPLALLALASCGEEPTVTDADASEFERAAAAFQDLYDLEEYCPYLPEKRVVDAWSDRALLSPVLAYDFVAVIFEADSGARLRETTSRLWRRTADEWKIVRMNNVLGPIPEADSGE